MADRREVRLDKTHVDRALHRQILLPVHHLQRAQWSIFLLLADERSMHGPVRALSSTIAFFSYVPKELQTATGPSSRTERSTNPGQICEGDVPT